MPPQQGEVSLLTLFADVHFYFGPPSSKPPHHRFDRGSYIYLYHNPIRQNGRLEIANHAGTPEQDAFAGNLDTVTVEQSYKHPCLFTITVDGLKGQGSSNGGTPQQDLSQWHLPTFDPRNEQKYMYRLHTVDLYFWTQDDATMFLDSLRRVLQPHQLQIVSNPHATPTHAEHKSDSLNPVVAKLERAAISHNSRSPSISTTNSFPGPPSQPAPPASVSPAASGNFAPMAYNPAAPAAPEPIAHREKTPPPPDAADGTGLATAAMHDQAPQQQYNPLQSSFAPQSTSSTPYLPGPPSRSQTFSGPPTPGLPRTGTSNSGSLPPPPQSPPAFAPPPSAPPLSQYDQQTPQPGLNRQSSVPIQQYANYPGSPGHPPVQSPGFPSPLPSPSYSPQQHQQYQPLASPPLTGGFTQYQYGSTAQQGQQQQNPQAMHSQLYRPTEHEAKAHQESGRQHTSNTGRRVEKVEKGIGRLLKKVDKW